MNIRKIMLAAVLFLIGTGPLVFGFYDYTSTSNFVEKSKSTTGTVLNLLQERDSEGSILYKPFVSFQTENGELIEFASKTSSYPASYSIGENVSVLYDPSDPYNAQLNSFSSLWFGILIFFVVGISFMGAGLSMFITELRAKQSEDIWFDPVEFIKSKTIDVYVDPVNFKKYYMDISFLPHMESPLLLCLR